MPRLISTLSRILKFIFISWFSLISLWIFLPSPAITPGTTTQTRYVQQTLVDSGRVLHTIYLWDESFDVASVTILPANTLYPGSPRQRARVSSGGADSTHLLVDWRLSHHSSNKHDARNDIVILGMGRDVRYQLNLTDAVMKVQSHNDEEDPDLIRISEEDGSDEIIYVGDQVTVQVDEGGADHIINMPWFHLPDAALFHNQMHGFTRDIHIRVVARYLKAETKTVVEIWKSAPVTEWLRLRWEKKYGRPIDGLAANNNDDGLAGEYYVKNIFRSDESHYYSSGLLASFVNVYNPHDVSTAEDLQVTIRGDAQLPSRTYWIRSMILVPLAPSLMIAFSLWLGLIDFLSFLICYEILALVAFYCVAVLVCWLVYDLRRRRRRGEKTEESHENREMRFLEWLSKFWLTRYVYAFLAYCCCCCCCCCCRSKRRGGGYRSDEKWGGKRIVIWGPAGPVYEDVINR